MMTLREYAELLNDSLHGDRTHRVWLIEAFMSKLVDKEIPAARDERQKEQEKDYE